MRFLCFKHERIYDQQPDEHLMEQWNAWMHSAGVCYDCGDWSKAASFVGSAFDLAKIRLAKNAHVRADAMAQVTLSAIYLANVLQHMGHLCESRYVLQMAGDCLNCFSCTEDAACASELLSCLEDENLREQLIGRFLNLPYRPCRWSRRGLH